jgi:hypothetical protein
MGVVLDSVNSICSGKYTVYVSDASGDTATGIVYLTNPPAMQISFPQVTPAGCHHSDGSVTATVTGAGIYTYSWNTSPAQHTPQASGLASGTYTVTAINYNGCSNSASIAITDSCFFVWPGDANDDGVADNNDILAIGIGYGKSGTSRFSASTNWVGQPSADWADTLKGGINFKFIDCNGDGVINSSDTTAVIQNYGFLHNHQPMINPPFDASVPTLYLKNIPDSIAANAYGSIQLELGTATLPANTLYGLAFNIHFDPSLIDPASIRLNLNSSWMGSNGVNLIGIAKTTSSGMTGIAITRINKLNASGNGLIGKITFKTTGSLIGTMNTRETGITITDLKVISADQSLLTLNAVGDSLLVEDPRLMVGIQSSSLSTLDISLAPNPFDESTTLSIKGVNNTIDYLLYDIVGKEVRHFRSAENKVVIHKENLSQGIYLLKLFSGGQFVGKEKLIIR